MDRPTTFLGAGARLYVDTRGAMAQLSALLEYARTVRAELGTLPAAQASTIGTQPSPLLSRPPISELPGTAIPAVQASISAGGGNVSVPKSKMPKKPQPVPFVRDAGASAAKRTAQAFGGETPTGLLTPTAAAEAAAEAGIGAAQIRKLSDRMGQGLGFGASGPHVGAYQLSSHGLGLAHAFNQTVGPYYGYLVGAYLGVELAGFVGRETMDAVRIAAANGQTLSQYVVQNFPAVVQRLAGRYEAAGIELFDKVADPVRDAVGGLGAAIISELGGNRRQVEDWLDRIAAAKQSVADFVAKQRGEKTSAQVRREEIQQRGTETQIAINDMKKKADELGEKAAQQLLGLGFPGTFDDLKSAAAATYRDVQAEKLEAKIIDDLHSRLTNGKTG